MIVMHRKNSYNLKLNAPNIHIINYQRMFVIEYKWSQLLKDVSNNTANKDVFIKANMDVFI